MGLLTLRIYAPLLVALLTAAAPVRAAPSSSPAAPLASAASAATAKDAGLVTQIMARLAQPKGIRAHFTQTQTLAAMRGPLVSNGSLLFFRDRGLIWQIDTPYKKTWVMGDSGIVEVDATGHRIANGGAQGERGAAEVAKMMRAMLGGDLSALYSQFDVEARGTPSRWQMRLVPRQPQLAQAVIELELSGGDFLQRLHISLANGDEMQFDFTGSTEVTDLTPADETLFGTP
jgi:outer membrane lipoprotein-sorting protein